MMIINEFVGKLSKKDTVFRQIPIGLRNTVMTFNRHALSGRLIAMELGDASALGEVAAFARKPAARAIQCFGVLTDGAAIVQEVAGTSYLNEWIVVLYA